MNLFDRLRAFWARLRGRDTFVDSRGRLCWSRPIAKGEVATIDLSRPGLWRALRRNQLLRKFSERDGARFRAGRR